MKPLQGDQQLQAVSLAYSVALQALKPKSLSTKNKGLDASTHRGLTESSGEVFLLDILSHRISVMVLLALRNSASGAVSTLPVHLFSCS